MVRGYVNQPELTAERFVEDVIGKRGKGSRLYKTGDLVRRLREAGNWGYSEGVTSR